MPTLPPSRGRGGRRCQGSRLPARDAPRGWTWGPRTSLAPPRSTAGCSAGTPEEVAGDRGVRELHVQGPIGGRAGPADRAGSAVLDHVRLGGERRRGHGQGGGSWRHHGRRADGRHDAGPNGDVPGSGRCTLLGLAGGRPHRCRRRQRAEHALLERDGHTGTPTRRCASTARSSAGRRSTIRRAPTGTGCGSLVVVASEGCSPWTGTPRLASRRTGCPLRRRRHRCGDHRTREPVARRRPRPSTSRPTFRRAGRPPGRPLLRGGPGPGRPATLIDPIRSRAAAAPASATARSSSDDPPDTPIAPTTRPPRGSPRRRRRPPAAGSW